MDISLPALVSILALVILVFCRLFAKINFVIFDLCGSHRINIVWLMGND